MRKVLAIMFTFGLLLVPFAAYSQSDQQASQPPPVAPPLVREGDFAVKLVGALNIGTAKNEVEAQSMLVSAGIAPRNGWISDYPVTPDIIAEIQKAVGEAADANRLPMGKSDSLNAVQSVQASLDLAMVPDMSGTYAQTQPPTTPQYVEPPVVENYYYDQGPPIVTYYPPPWDYSYLYAWVPSPFWFGGFFFPGFFICNNFNRIVFVNGHRCFVSNHVFDHNHHRFFTVDPVRRWQGARESLRPMPNRSAGRAFTTAEARRGAESILQRSREQMMPSKGATGTNFASRGQSSPSFNGRGGAMARIVPRQNFRAAPGSSTGSLNAPVRAAERSFSPSPMRSGVRSFSPPSTGSREFSGGFHGLSGGFSGGFHGSQSGQGGSWGGFHGGGSGGFSHGGGFRGR